MTRFPLRLLGFVLTLSTAAAADPFLVTSNADAGPGTLRAAIEAANSGGCPHACRISFQFEGPEPPRGGERRTLRIELVSELPAIAVSQMWITTGGEPFDVRSEVIVDGSRAGAVAVGLRVTSARSFDMTGVRFEHFGGGGGIIDRAASVLIRVSGFNDNGGDGLVVRDSSDVRLSILTLLGNRNNGAFLQRVTNGTLDSSNIGAREIDREHREIRPNGGNGVHLDDADGVAVDANRIQNNGGNGILITGDSADNYLEGNKFGDNAFLAIDLGGDGPTANDPIDADFGPNGLQNTPIIESATYNRGWVRVRGHLISRPSTKYSIDFSIADAPDPTGFGEGSERVLTPNTPSVTTDAGGRAEFFFDFEDGFGPRLRGRFVMAMATRFIGQFAPWGESSELSRTVAVVDGPITFEITHTGDAGPGSLRAAIDAANATDCAPTFVCEIAFRIPTTPAENGVWTIRPQSQLPALVRSGIWLDGGTQTEFAGNTNPDGPEVEINGAACSGCNGIELRAPIRSVALTLVRDLIINGFSGHGVYSAGAPPDRALGGRVDGLYIGTDATGTRAVPNGGSGVFIEDAHLSVGSVFDNRIPARAPRGCVISGNVGDGITTTASTTTYGAGVTARGNIISSDRTSFYPLPNGGNGIASSSFARIRGNLIGFSTGAGVLVTGTSGVNDMRGNFIHSSGGKGLDIRRTGVLGAPVIESARFENGKTRIRYTLDAPKTKFPHHYWIDTYASSFTDASGRGEARRFLRATQIDNSQTVYEIVLDENLFNKFIAMTATPYDSFYDAGEATTSELSESVQVTADNCEGESASPELPAAGATVSDATTFRWSAVPGAVTYRMWAMKPGGAPFLVFDGPTPSAVVTLAPGTYEWWVETRFACAGPQSAHRTVTVE